MAKSKAKYISDARKEVKKGKYDKAIISYEKALEEDPNDYNLRITLGDTYAKADKNFDAVKSYESAADICQKEGLMMPAIAVCKKITRTRPEYAQAYLRLGELYGERRLLKDAMDNYNKYADLMLKEGKMDEVLSAYKAIVDLAPANLTIRSRLAELYISQQHVSEAITELTQLKELYRKQGNDEKADEVGAKIDELGGAAVAVSPGAAKSDDSSEEGGTDEIAMDMGALSTLDDGVPTPTVEASAESTPSPTKPPSEEVSEESGIGGIEMDLSGLDGLDISAEAMESVTEPTTPSGPSPPLPDLSSTSEGGFEIPSEDIPTEISDGLPSLEAGEASGIEISDDTIIGSDSPSAPPVKAKAKPKPEPEEEVEDADDILAAMGILGDSDEDEAEDSEEPEAEPVEEAPPEPEPPKQEIQHAPAAPPAAPPAKEEEELLPKSIPEAAQMLEQNPTNWKIYVILGGFFEEEAERNNNFDQIMNAVAVYQRAAEGFESENNIEGAADAYLHWMSLSKTIESPGNIVQDVLQKLSRYTQLLDNKRVIARIYQQVAQHYVEEDDYSSAGAYYQQMIESAYPVMEKTLISDGYVGLAKVLIHNNDIQTARKRLEAALKFDKAHSEAAQLMMKIDMGEISATAPEPVVQPSPSPAPTTTPPTPERDYVDIQGWFSEDDKDQDVIDIRQEAPDFVDSDSVEDIIKEFRSGLEDSIKDEDYGMRYDLGVAYKEMGLLDEAISEFQKATAGGDQQLRAYESMGVCFLEKNEPRFALRWLLKGLELSGYSEKQYIGLHFYMGRAYEELGETEKAMREYEEVYVLDVSFEDVQQRIERLSKIKGSSSSISKGSAEFSTSPQSTPTSELQPPSPKEPAGGTISGDSFFGDGDFLTPAQPTSEVQPPSPKEVADDGISGDSFFGDDDLDIPALDGSLSKEDKKPPIKKPKKAKRDKRISYI